MKSIRRQLLLWLLPALAGTLIAATGFSYLQAERGLSEVFDYHLREVAHSLEDQSVLAIAVDDDARRLGDDQILLQIWDHSRGIVLISQRGRELPLVADTGFHNIAIGGARYRVYSLVLPDRVIQVAQPEHVRRELSASIAAHSMLPFALALPLLILVALLAVSKGLRPLRRVAREVAARTPESLDAIPTADLPLEIAPLAAGLNGLLTRLGDALEGQRAFIADAAHELRSPMAALRLQAQLIDRSPGDEERREAVARLQQGVLRASHLVEQLLALARLDPKAPLKAEPVDLLRVAKEVVADRVAQAEARGVDLGVDRAQAAPLVGDPLALRTLVSNIVDNAVRYAPPQGHVNVSAWPESGCAVVEVVDDGPGIPPELRQRVFDRFYRVEGTTQPGSGLGLAIVQRIAERHGGRVALEDGPGGIGLRVRVTLPAGTAAKSG